MITWTTPTIPVHVRHANLVATGCHVLVTIAQQGCASVTVEDPPMAYDSDTDTTTLLVGLTQEQCGSLHPGPAKVQVNAVDWSGWRVASDQATATLGSNLIREVLHG